MNLVFVGSSPRAWGSEQHFIGLAQACHEAGHRVIAVVRAGSEVEALMKAAGIDVRGTAFRGGADPRAMFATFRAVREIRADWLVTPHKKHYWPLYLLARATGTKLAVFRHLVYVRDWVTRVLFPRLADRFFVVSDFALEALVAAGAPRERLTRLYNPIDLHRFQPSPELRESTRKLLGISRDAFVVGFVGRHEIGKGVRELRQALADAMNCEPTMHAVWLGSGPEWLATRAAIADCKHSARHRFVDWTRTPERFYPAFDCLVAPSIELETFGRVVAEAQACGIPVISSVAGGLREAFADGISGYRVKGSDAGELTESIMQMTANDVGRQEMANAARRFVDRFDSRVIAKLFLQDLGNRTRRRSLRELVRARSASGA